MPLYHPADIQQPWSAWTPTFACSGSMTITGSSIQIARYNKVGKVCFMELAFSGTLGGTAASAVTATLPSGIGSNSGIIYYPCYAVDGDGSAEPAAVANVQTTGGGGKITFYKDAIATVWTLGASFAVMLGIAFEAE